MSFAVWLTGLPGSGKSAVTRELLKKLQAGGVAAAVLESGVMRTQLTPFPRYDFPVISTRPPRPPRAGGALVWQRNARGAHPLAESYAPLLLSCRTDQA